MTLGAQAKTRPDHDAPRWRLVACWSLACLAAGVIVLLDLHTVVRAPLVLVAMIGGPGWALCCFLCIRDRALVWALAVAIGVALNVLLGLAMIAFGSWHPIGASVIVLFASGGVLVARAVVVAPQPHRGTQR